MTDHDDPHFLETGACDCDCAECTEETYDYDGDPVCICADCTDCNAKMCGLHVDTT